MTTDVTSHDKAKKSQPGGSTTCRPGEREARGKAARAEVPRSSHAAWEPPPLRRPPSTSWRSRRRRACRSSCRSGTGGCSSRRSRSTVAPPTSWHPTCRGCREAGCMRNCAAMRTCRTSVVFASPDRRLVFSINDFDETLPGPFEWDVKRLVASFAVAGRDRGFGDKQRNASTSRSDGPTGRRCDGSRYEQPRALVHAPRR